jgi:hypothetical protein
VLRKLDMVIPDNVIEGLVACKPGVVEVVLGNIRSHLEAV